MKTLISIFATAVAVSACAYGSQFEIEKARLIKPGMTEQEVIALIGKPFSRTQRVGDEVLTWANYNTLDGSSKVVSLIMVDGKVKATSP